MDLKRRNRSGLKDEKNGAMAGCRGEVVGQASEERAVTETQFSCSV
jgi:hypothetical protein